jgi:formamidopyrimidine-DNA glycosylase
MPELPEVETIRRTLVWHVAGRTIETVAIGWPGAIVGWRDKGFSDIVQGQMIEDIERRGKYLLIRLSENWTMIAHMRMTGRLFYYPKAEPVEKHTHVVFRLNQGELHFNDVRKFGRIMVVPTGEQMLLPALARLGPEPLESGFTPEVMHQRLQGNKRPIKAALLAQDVVAGLGNIYTDEALFLARLNPMRPAQSLTEKEVEVLHGAIIMVLQAGIEAQGTSFRDYRDANGEKGAFQEALQVYGRANEPCQACGRPLAKSRLAGRTTVFCPECQH